MLFIQQSPLVGQLFRYTSNEKSKRNLMVFIRPTIIRDDEVYRSLSREKYTNFKDLQKERREKQSETLINVDNIKELEDRAFNNATATPDAKNPFREGRTE
ncbi:hypothetical protein AAG991_19665 [Enterobacter kobei]